jgi:hypothetical protein
MDLVAHVIGWLILDLIWAGIKSLFRSENPKGTEGREAPR